MKYVLKKDLPFARIGDPITINKNLIMCCGYVLFNSSSQLTLQYDLISLEKDGWIEEVKPREWNVLVDRNDNLFSNVGFKPEANCKTIRVREVIS